MFKSSLALRAFDVSAGEGVGNAIYKNEEKRFTSQPENQQNGCLCKRFYFLFKIEL